MIDLCNRIIRYGYYLLFLLVPLVISNNTSELFEFNKMWLTFGITIIIGAAWFTKAIVEKKFTLQRTPLDIPILIFLLAHIVSTLFSLDFRISIWGYYSRFNGGLLSIITYIFLYYAFVSNFLTKEGASTETPNGIRMVKRLLVVSLLSATIVALWGLPSHFGYDPTCFLFRGSLDVSCWTEAFQPTVRIFSTIGQPAWLAAYLSILLPISMAYLLREVFKRHIGKFNLLLFIAFAALVTLLYVDLIFANTRAGFLGFWIANTVFWIVLFIRKLFPKDMLLRWGMLINGAFLILTFFLGTPIAQINQLTYPALQEKLSNTNENSPRPEVAASPSPTPPPGEFAGTDSGTIRLYVWQGAIDAWKAHPIFGTGVETFAFAYYKHRPVGHNTTSEWDYLYNKAHNEYLNYLTTTGILGLGSYLAIIGTFLLLFLKQILSKYKFQNTHNQDSKLLNLKDSNLSRISEFELRILSAALVASFVSILVSNFFGFSVVIVNVYFFLIPAFVFLLEKSFSLEKRIVIPKSAIATSDQPKKLTLYQQSAILIILVLAGFKLLMLINFWRADVAYAYGYNLDRVNEYQQAYPYLQKAISLRSAEPLFQDELGLNTATLATAFFAQQDATTAAQLANEATRISNEVVMNNPNNIVYWKSRVRIFYTLAQIDPRYYDLALEAMQKSRELAPTDAKVLYNLAVLTGQIGRPDEGIRLLDEVIRLKPNYSDAYFAKGLFYRELATDENENVTDSEMQQKAVENMQYILQNFNKDDERVLETLKDWNAR